MPEVDTVKTEARAVAPKLVAAIVAVGMFLLLLYLGLSRYYNAQEVESLVQGAIANGQTYLVEIHNGLTGSYSFNAG
jgi:hypothetical protein